MMKGIVLSSFLTAVLVSGGFVIVQMGLEGDGSSRAATALDVQALEGRLSGIEEKLEGIGTLDDLVRRVESRLEARQPVASPAAASESVDPDAASDSSDENLVASARAARQAGTHQAGGESKELREFIATVIEDERSARDERRSTKMRERSREIKEMNKGPYGKHNFKVNSLAKKLDFSEKQREHYYNTLVQYSDESRVAGKGLDWKDSEAVKSYHTLRKELKDGFHGEVALGLDREQAEQYSELPDWEKNPDGRGRGTFLRAMSSTGEPGSAVISFDAAQVHLEVPDPVLGQTAK